MELEDAYWLKIDGEWQPFTFLAEVENTVAAHLGLAPEQTIFTFEKNGTTYFYADKFVAADNRRDRSNDLQCVTSAELTAAKTEPMRMPDAEPMLPLRPIRGGGPGDSKSSVKVPEKHVQTFAVSAGR